MSDPVHLAMSRIKLEGCDIVQVLAETEYQDLYRITDGVLLVVNKFKPINYGKDKYRLYEDINSGNFINPQTE